MEESNAHLLNATDGFQCSEKIDKEAFDNIGDLDGEEEDEVPLPVKFHVTLPLRKNNSIRYELEFGCRRPSFDALNKNENRLEEGEFEESAADPNFFDKGYTLAGSTGFTVWAGARFMLDALVSANTPDERLTFWQDRIEAGTKVLELGAVRYMFRHDWDLESYSVCLINYCFYRITGRWITGHRSSCWRCSGPHDGSSFTCGRRNSTEYTTQRQTICNRRVSSTAIST